MFGPSPRGCSLPRIAIEHVIDRMAPIGLFETEADHAAMGEVRTKQSFAKLDYPIQDE